MRKLFVLIVLGTTTLIVAASLLSKSLAQNSPSTPSGAMQPTAPGFKIGAPLSTIKLRPAIAEVKRIQYLSNGFIEASHALVLIPKKDKTLQGILTLAQKVATQTLAARSSLAVVDVSIYQAEGYAGFGGPSPLLTVSVPRQKLGAFNQIKVSALDEYDHLWVNPVASPLPPQIEATGETPFGTPETLPKLVGNAADLKTEQQKALKEGGIRKGLFFQGSRKKPLIALTFDDGVHPLYTPLILDSLRRTGAKATFFVVGRNVLAYPYFVRDLAREGHELANHTFNHVRLVGLPVKVVREELAQTNILIQSITGEPVRFFRPPGGRYTRAILKIAYSLGMSTAFWTSDPADFNNPGSLVLETRLLRYLRPGGIVLLHDNAPQTPPLLADFINDARTAGIKMVTLETLAQP